MTQAIALEDFAAALAALDPGARLALAVSGGRDSMALLRLAVQAAPGAGATVRAFIVDHGLRPASAAEAAQTAAWCRAVGVEADILEWAAPKPASGVQAAARTARYRLLAEAAAAAGASALLTAHSADDQAETVLMRLARGAGVPGLAAMRPAIRIAAGAGAPVRLLRPLLGFSRAALTQTVRRYNQPFLDDPSNENPAFERVRMRRALAGLADAGLLEPSALALSAARLNGAADRLQRAEARAFRRAGGVFTRWGAATLSLRLPYGADADHAPALLARLVGAIGGGAHAPDPAAARRVAEAALGEGAATLGGALLKVWRERLWILREPAALLGRTGAPGISPQALRAGIPALWDDRFIVIASENGTLRPLGRDGAAALGAAANLFDGPPEALAALPGVYCDDRLIAAPGLLCGQEDICFTALAAERFAGDLIRF